VTVDFFIALDGRGRQPPTPLKDLKPTVLLVRPEQDLCWRGSVWVRGVFDGTHCMRLTAVANGTRLEQTETFSGLLAGRLTKDVIQETRREFQLMNTAVKRRAEANPS
jgi:hypothetical protein